VAVALGSGDVALYALPAGALAAEDGCSPPPAARRLAPVQTLRHRCAGGADLSAWRVQFNATGTALAASVAEEPEGEGGGGGGGRGAGLGGGGGWGGAPGDDGPPPQQQQPAQVWFWMPNLESGVWRAVASVEGSEDVGGDDRFEEGEVMRIEQSR